MFDWSSGPCSRGAMAPKRYTFKLGDPCYAFALHVAANYVLRAASLGATFEPFTQERPYPEHDRLNVREQGRASKCVPPVPMGGFFLAEGVIGLSFDNCAAILAFMQGKGPRPDKIEAFPEVRNRSDRTLDLPDTGLSVAEPVLVLGAAVETYKPQINKLAKAGHEGAEFALIARNCAFHSGCFRFEQLRERIGAWPNEGPMPEYRVHIRKNSARGVSGFDESGNCLDGTPFLKFFSVLDVVPLLWDLQEWLP